MWTDLGCGLPIVGLIAALLWSAPALAIASLVAALFAPSLGHLVYRRVLTRGFALRLIAGAIAGLLVSGAQRSDPGTSIAFILIAGALVLIGFITGMVFDVIDAVRAADRR
jgi:MFS-type transporter involved in bile tolerance (Atg22 family)